MTMFLLERHPSAEQFVQAIRTLPRDIAPEYWYEFEPNPKANRLYLENAFEEYHRRMLEHSAYGSLERAHYALSVSGFLGPKAEIGSSYMCAVNPRRMGKKLLDISSLMAVSEHLIDKGDMYCGYYEDWDAAQMLTPYRVDALLQRQPNSEITPYNVKPSRNYLAGKFVFPGFHWRTLLSEECIADYGINMDRVAQAAWRCTRGGPGGLWDIQFCETLQEWPDVWDRAFALTADADFHRFEGVAYRDLFDGVNKPNDPATWHTGKYLDGKL